MPELNELWHWEFVVDVIAWFSHLFIFVAVVNVMITRVLKHFGRREQRASRVRELVTGQT